MYDNDRRINRLVGLVIILMIISLCFIGYLVYDNYIMGNKCKSEVTCEPITIEKEVCTQDQPEISLSNYYKYEGYYKNESDEVFLITNELLLNEDNTFIYSECNLWCNTISGSYQIKNNVLKLTANREYNNDCYIESSRDISFLVTDDNRLITNDNKVLVEKTSSDSSDNIKSLENINEINKCDTEE